MRHQALELLLGGHDGKVVELCQQILKDDQNDAIGHLILGTVAIQRGDSASASFHLNRARQPQGLSITVGNDIQNVAALHCRVANLLLTLGNRSEALAHFERAYALLPDSEAILKKLYVAHSVVGVYFSEQGRYAEAVPHFERAYRLNRNSDEYRQRMIIARYFLENCLPRLAHHHFDGKAQSFIEYRDSGCYIDAARIAEDILKTSPASLVMLIEYGKLHWESRRLDDAVSCFRRAKSIIPDSIPLSLLLGHCLLEQKDWHNIYSTAGFRNPPWSTTGFCQSKEFECVYEKNIVVPPGVIVELSKVALDLTSIGYFDEVIGCCNILRKYMGGTPDGLKQILYVLATSLLSQGRFREAAPIMIEWGVLLSAERSVRLGPDYKEPVWKGEDISEKVLCVYTDQGFGDIFQFLRFIPVAAAGCRKLILQAPGSLLRLMKNLGDIPNVEIVAGGSSEYHQGFDYICSLYILPHLIGIDPPALSKAVPYLFAEPDLVAQWGRRLPEAGFRIGIVWRSNPNAPEERKGRPIPLASFVPIARLAGVRMIALQVQFGLDELNALPDGMTVTTLGPDLYAGPDQFVDTAAVIQSLDLIISSDTSVPHLAGALGCPVWVLLKAVPDWRWMLGRDDSPWYPTMRLFRQKVAGEWEEVIDRVCEEVAKRVQWKASYDPQLRDLIEQA